MKTQKIIPFLFLFCVLSGFAQQSHLSMVELLDIEAVTQDIEKVAANYELYYDTSRAPLKHISVARFLEEKKNIPAKDIDKIVGLMSFAMAPKSTDEYIVMGYLVPSQKAFVYDPQQDDLENLATINKNRILFDLYGEAESRTPSQANNLDALHFFPHAWAKEKFNADMAVSYTINRNTNGLPQGMAKLQCVLLVKGCLFLHLYFLLPDENTNVATLLERNFDHVFWLSDTVDSRSLHKYVGIIKGLTDL